MFHTAQSCTESDTERSDHSPINNGFGEVARVNRIIKTVICWNKFGVALLLETDDSLDIIIGNLERATKRVRIMKGLPDPGPSVHKLLATRKRVQRRYRRLRSEPERFCPAKSYSRAA